MRARRRRPRGAAEARAVARRQQGVPQQPRPASRPCPAEARRRVHGVARLARLPRARSPQPTSSASRAPARTRGWRASRAVAARVRRSCRAKPAITARRAAAGRHPALRPRRARVERASTSATTLRWSHDVRHAMHPVHAHAGAACDASSGTSPCAPIHASVILPHGVIVSRGSAFDTGHALRHSFGQKTQSSSADLRGCRSGRLRIARTSGRSIVATSSPRRRSRRGRRRPATWADRSA